MSMDQSVSDAARRSLSRFSATLWTVGAIVMAVIAFSTFARLEWDPQTGALRDTGGDGYSAYPWQDENLPEIEPVDGDVYSGAGNAVVRIPNVTEEPLQVEQISDVGVRLSMTESGDIDPATPVDDREWPLSVGSPQPDLPSVVFPYEGTLELWVEVEGSDQWTIRIQPLDGEELTDVASGTGNGLLVYRGPAASALFEFVGEGIFFVTAYTREEGEESLIIESDPLKERHSWQPSDVVVLSIESDGDRGAWTIDIDDYATEPPTPDPGETPADAPSGSPAETPADDPTEQENP